MKLKEFLNSRVWLYLIFTLIYHILWKLGGFEFTVIIGIGQIFGEMHYQYKE